MKFLFSLLLFCTAMSGIQAQASTSKPPEAAADHADVADFPPARKIELFSGGWESATKAYGTQLRAGAVFNFDAQKAAEFLKQRPAVFSLDLPTGKGDEILTVHLKRSQILAKDFKVVTSSNPDKAFDYQGGLHFHGVVEGDAHSKVAISVFDNEVMGLIITHDGNYNLGRLKNDTKAHVMYLDADLLKKPDFNCGMEDDKHEYANEVLHGAPKAAGDCVGVYFEVDKSVVDNKGGVANATNFVIGAFNQNALLYAAEMIDMNIREMFVWDTTDPYTGPGAGNYLDQFQANTGAFNGNLGHLVAMVDNGGIAAGFEGICNPNTDESLCYSGILDFYENVPVFSFTVMILAHEMGHLLGSRHTHACVWNGNNTAIDGCAGFVETDVANCALPGSPAGGGTIMSYCHNDAVGVNFNLGFGPQPGNVIRNTVANAACLNAVCVGCDMTIANVTTTPPATCTGSDGSITITATSSSGPITYSLAGPVNQSNTTGVFTGLPLGNYSITTEDNIGCVAFGTANVGNYSADVPKTISNSGTPTVTSVLNFSGSGSITDITLNGLNISHTWVGDLKATLTSPQGTVITLFDRPGVPTSNLGCDKNNIQVNFDDAATFTAANFETTCNASSPAISGTYQPIMPLATYLGEEANGQWTLTVSDTQNGDGGSITSWSLLICTLSCDVAITNVVKTDETCPNANNGSITVTATTSAGPLTYAISGPVNQSNATGAFTGLPDGNYNITVTDNGATNCTAASTATVAAGVDNTPPTITCPTTQTLVLGANCSAALPDYTSLATTGDNCGVQGVTQSPVAGTTVSSAGNMSVTLTVTDINGNFPTQCTFTVTKVDNTAPTITCPTTQTLALGANCSAALPDYTSLATTGDNCGVQGVAQSPVAGTTVSGTGNMTVTLTVTDVNGLTNTCTFTVSKVDNTPPTPVCQNTTILLGNTGTYTLLSADVLNAQASSDNCSSTLVVTNISPATLNCSQVGQTVPVTVSVQDGSGNSASCVAQVTVQEGTSLPDGWSSSNVGNANGSAGYKTCSAGSFTVTANGSSTSSSDVLHLASRSLCGNGEIIAQVTNVSGGGWAGIMLRESLAPGAKKVTLKTQLSNIIRREVRTSTNGATTSLNLPRPQHTWLRLVRTGSSFTGYTSIDGSTWTFAFSATLSMTNCIYAGVFSESINVNTTTTAEFAGVSVTTNASLSAINTEDTGSDVLNLDLGLNLNLFPNPSSGEVTVDFTPWAGQPALLQVYDLYGRRVHRLALDEATGPMPVDLSQLPAGVYLFRVGDAQQRVVLQR